MTIKDFATRYNLRLRTDKQDHTLVIPGSIGHIYEYSPSELGVMFLPAGDPKPRLYSSTKSKCLAVGMIVRQDCDAEGAFSFDPSDDHQSRLAIKAAGVRPKKRISETHKCKLLEGFQTFKNSGSGGLQEGGLAC
jgi:hypothetical protein